MVQINFALREVSCKIVYYGPGLSGKTTNLEIVHQKAPAGHKGKMTSLATEGDRTLFFDFLPLDLGSIGGMKTKFQLYTVPGQVYYNATRKLVLRGTDGIVFVADSDATKMDENLESLENLEQNLKENGLDINEMPVVFQWNKRDLASALPVTEMEQKLNRWGGPSFEAVAIKGEGVFPTLKALAGLVLESVNARGVSVADAAARKSAQSRPSAAAPAPTPPPEPRAVPRPTPAPTPAPPRPVARPSPPTPGTPYAARPAPGFTPPPLTAPRGAPLPTSASPPPAAPAMPPASPYQVPGYQPPYAWQRFDQKKGIDWSTIGFLVTVAVLIAVIGYLLFFYGK